jgi:trk system potassium uptake protein TrkA
METNDINVLALVEREQGQVLRLVLPENYPDTRIKDISFGARAIIGVVKRGRNLLIPNGDTLLKAGDRLKIFTMAKHAENINTLFSP